MLAHCDVDGAVTQAVPDRAPMRACAPGTVLAGGVHIGNFVETKQAQFGEGAKANHLAHRRDASIGARANIGAGTITCNYDGASKHRTEIGEDAFIGSNSALVAPVNIGRHATIGAGSVISKDAPADSLTWPRPAGHARRLAPAAAEVVLTTRRRQPTPEHKRRGSPRAVGVQWVQRASASSHGALTALGRQPTQVSKPARAAMAHCDKVGTSPLPAAPPPAPRRRRCRGRRGTGEARAALVRRPTGHVVAGVDGGTARLQRMRARTSAVVGGAPSRGLAFSVPAGGTGVAPLPPVAAAIPPGCWRRRRRCRRKWAPTSASYRDPAAPLSAR